MPLTASLRLKMAASVTGTDDFGGPSYDPVIEHLIALADGAAAGQADIPWFDERSVGADSNDDIDLAGVLTNAFGAIITMAELVAIAVVNARRSGLVANVSNLTIGLGANPFLGFLGGTTPTLGPIRPGGVFFLACGDAAGIGTVTAGTGDILRIANVGSSAVYQIGILARSVA